MFLACLKQTRIGASRLVGARLHQERDRARGSWRGLHIATRNPSGLCWCGCGQPSPESRYLRGHRPRRSWSGAPVEYAEEDRGHETPCWVWQLRLSAQGYGVIGTAQGTVYAHRLYYEAEHGPIPDGLEIDHLCRVPFCCRPSHLEAVTHAENVRRGIGTRVTAEKVAEIRRLSEIDYRRRVLAMLFGIAPSHVRNIVRREVWKAVA